MAEAGEQPENEVPSEEDRLQEKFNNIVARFGESIQGAFNNINAGDARDNEIAKSNLVRILAGTPVSNTLVPKGGSINQNSLESSNPELTALLGDPSQGEIVLSYPEHPFREDVNHMILFQMFEKEDESERIFKREKSKLGDKEITKLLDEINTVRDFSDPTSQFNAGTDYNPDFGPTSPVVIESDYINRETLGGQPSYDRSITFKPNEYLGTKETIQNEFETTYVYSSGKEPGASRDKEGKYKPNFRPPFVDRGISSKPKYKAKQNIFLYMPTSINETNIQTYDTPELLLATFLTGTAKSAYQAGAANGFGAAVEQVLDDLVNNTSLLTRAGAGLIDSAANILSIPLNTEATLTQLRGLAINPRKEQTYTAPDFRTFSYVFELYPRNRRETEMVNSMIRLFKYHSYPDLDSTGNLFVTPAIFRIKYLYKSQDALVENLWLNRIKDCILTECQVDYTSPGQFTTFSDGSPVGVKLSLTFRETTVVTKGDILEGA